MLNTQGAKYKIPTTDILILNPESYTLRIGPVCAAAVDFF